LRTARLAAILAAGLALAGSTRALAREVRFKPDRAAQSAASRQRLEHWAGFPCLLGADGHPPELRLGAESARPGRAAGHDLRIVDGSDAATGPGGEGVAPAQAPAGLAPRDERWPSRFAFSAVDTLRVAMVRVEFETDRLGDSTTTIDGRFDTRTGITAAVDPPPHDRAFFADHGRALANYYRAQSDGHLELSVSVFPEDPTSAYRLTDTADYGPWAILSDHLTVAEQARRLISDGLNAAAASGDIDFPSFDAFILVHAGADFQSDVNQDSPYDIPTFVLDFGESDTLVVGGKRIYRCMVIPETSTQDGFSGALNGVIAHEFGHILGLPDLYNTRTGFPMVGWFSIMDSGHNIGAILVDPDSTEVEVFGALPSSFDAWCRMQLFGNADPDAVNRPGNGFLIPRIATVEESLHTSLGAVLLDHRLIRVPIHDSEYYLVENRELEYDGNGFPIIQADPVTGVILGPIADSTIANPDGRLEYDALLPSGGLLIWHIDDRVLYQDLVDPFGVNTNINRRGIKLVEADGIEDQGRRNFGTPWDPFYAGNNPFFGPYSLPATTTNDGQFSRIEIGTTSPPAVAMDVTVRRPTALTGWPIGLASDIVITSTGLLDVTMDGSPEMLFTFGRDIFAVEGKGGRPYPPLDEEGGATPWVRATAVLDRRLASGRVGDDTGDGPPRESPILAVLSTGSDEILAYRPDGTRIPAAPVPRTRQASTPPAVIDDARSFVPYAVAYAGYDGRAHLASVTNDFVRAADTESFSEQGAPDAGWGNVIAGTLAGNDGSTEVAWATEAGFVHVATTDGSVVGAGPDGTRLLRTLGSTPLPVGARRSLSLLAANFLEMPNDAWTLAAVDRTGKATVIGLDGATQPGWPVSFPAPLLFHAAAGDIDGDGLAELVVADTLANLHVVNGDGSNALHYPINLGARVTSGAMLADVDGEPGAEILVMTEDGSLHALTRAGREAQGFPIGFGLFFLAGNYLADFNGEGRTDIVAGCPFGILNGFSLDQAIPDSLIAWRGEDNGPTRNAVLDRRSAGGGNTPTAEARSLVCFPNPARGDLMNFRLTLDEGQQARASVYDMTGRPLAAGLEPTGGGPEANIVWHLGDVAPGVYLVRVDVDGPGATQSQVRLVSVLR
jgi:M6 family metalloprotease-like protein